MSKKTMGFGGGACVVIVGLFGIIVWVIDTSGWRFLELLSLLAKVEMRLCRRMHLIGALPSLLRT